MMIVAMPLPFHACTLEAVTTSVIHHNDQPLDYTGWSWFHVPYIGKYLCYSLDVINAHAKKIKVGQATKFFNAEISYTCT